MQLESPLSDLIWMSVAIPFLIYVFPTLIKYIVPLCCVDRSRNRQIKEFERSVIDYRRQLSNISEVQEFALYSKTKRKLNQVMKDLDTFKDKNPSYESRLILVTAILGKLASVYICFMLLKRFAVLLLEYIDFM